MMISVDFQREKVTEYKKICIDDWSPTTMFKIILNSRLPTFHVVELTPIKIGYWAYSCWKISEFFFSNLQVQCDCFFNQIAVTEKDCKIGIYQSELRFEDVGLMW